MTPKNDITAFSYDPNGNLLSRLLPNGEETCYSYDELNRVLAQTEGDYTIRYAYDPFVLLVMTETTVYRGTLNF